MRHELNGDEVIAFATELGWMSLRMRGDVIRQLSFGHASSAAAINAIAPGQVVGQQPSSRGHKIAEQLQLYARGMLVDFSGMSVACDDETEFQASVLKACRKIPYGQTITYGELAAAARAPGAARAAGNCMARNKVPLIIPCHRVVRVGGDVGPYSAAGGSATKRRLLQMEAANGGASL